MILEAEEEEEEEDLEAAFLNSLTKKQKKMLLKYAKHINKINIDLTSTLGDWRKKNESR